MATLILFSNSRDMYIAVNLKKKKNMLRKCFLSSELHIF